MPDALRACHDVKIIRFVSMWDHDGMIPTGDEHNVAILDRYRLVKIPRIAIDPLENESLRRIDAVVIGLLQETFSWHIVDVVLVGRIARGMPARGAHFHDEHRLGRLILRKNVAYITCIRSLSTNAPLDRSRLDQTHRQFALGGTARDREFCLGLARLR